MKLRQILTTAAALAVLVPAANAAPIDFDFTTLHNGSDNTGLSRSETVSDVTATGYQLSGASRLSTAQLWLRNQSTDHGLGVCSEGHSACSNGGGDVNELDNNGRYEAIVLDKHSALKWNELFVSSLDSNGSGGSEYGTLLWSNTLDQVNLMNNMFGFEYGDFGSEVEGDVLSLAAAANFDPTARYVAFVSGKLQGCSGSTGSPVIGCGGTNNDYLVWKGSVTNDVPEPTELCLLAFGLMMIGFGLHRRRSF